AEDGIRVRNVTGVQTCALPILAPVADVVPASVGEQNKPIAALGRGYGSDPQQVSDKVTAFIKGMAAAGEATAVKHFPGLGTVTGDRKSVAEGRSGSRGRSGSAE